MWTTTGSLPLPLTPITSRPLLCAQSCDDLHYVDLRDVVAFGSRRPQRSMVCRYISRTIDAQLRDVPTYFTCLSDIVDAIC